jgi:hypothetical protein
LAEKYEKILATEILEMGKQEGFSKRTIYRAKKKLKIKSKSESNEKNQKETYWLLREKEDNQPQLSDLKQIKEKTASDLKKIMETTNEPKSAS